VWAYGFHAGTDSFASCLQKESLVPRYWAAPPGEYWDWAPCWGRVGLNAVISAPRRRTQPRPTEGQRAVLTKDILFGMNILTLAGFVVMGLTLTLNRMGQTGRGLSVGLMAAGTALVFLGLYAGGWSG